MIDTKLDRLAVLLEILDYDPHTKTLTINGDINIKVKGNYELKGDKHVMIESNQDEIDKELNLPFSVFINSSEIQQRRTLANVKKLL